MADRAWARVKAADASLAEKAAAWAVTTGMNAKTKLGGGDRKAIEHDTIGDGLYLRPWKGTGLYLRPWKGGGIIVAPLKVVKKLGVSKKKKASRSKTSR